jgi:uridine kinase
MYGRMALKNHSLTSRVREATGVQSKRFVEPFILGVCGGSGSGKTTFCEQLVSILGADKVIHLSQDDYYRDLSHLNVEERAGVNFDHPDSVEFPLLTTHLDHLMQGLSIAVPKYDFSKHMRSFVQQIVSPKPIILVEGILLFADTPTTSRFKLKVFIDTAESVRFSRRLKRDVRESVQYQFQKTVLPMHNLFVEGKRGLADHVVSGEEPFEPSLLELAGYLMRQVMSQSSL